MDKINKILGLYELKELNIPKIEWKEFHPDTSYFKEDQLWTIRTATFKGNDFNLSRLIGGKAKEARIFALKEYKVFKNTGLIFYYPYFIAEKSGTLLINEKEIIIEGVHKDLWNLVTDNLRDVSIVEKDNMILSYGNKDFLSDKKFVNAITEDSIRSQMIQKLEEENGKNDLSNIKTENTENETK